MKSCVRAYLLPHTSTPVDAMSSPSLLSISWTVLIAWVFWITVEYERQCYTWQLVLLVFISIFILAFLGVWFSVYANIKSNLQKVNCLPLLSCASLFHQSFPGNGFQRLCSVRYHRKALVPRVTVLTSLTATHCITGLFLFSHNFQQLCICGTCWNWR